ncbi:MAG: hypothetical protein ACK5Y7_11295 [Betaproteobacteria bacterium]|jgi:hypothetical protein|nr:hypothetical protein [Rubrivivax sp.]
MSATLQAPELAEPVDLAAVPHDAGAALRAVLALLQGFAQAGHLSQEHAGQAARLVQVAAGPLLGAGEAVALQAAEPPVHPAEPDAEAEARAAELAELADGADGLSAGLELIGEACGSGDDRRVSQACRVAFTLASVAADLALALSDVVDREGEAVPLMHASWLPDSAEGLAAGLDLLAEACGSGDARRVSQACRVAFTLAGVAADLATALSEEAARQGLPPGRHP